MIRLDAPAWRILWAAHPNPLAPVRAPEGRFHHTGQPALYLSLSEAGAASALARYLGPDDPPRLIQKLHLRTDGIADLRNDEIARAAWHEMDRPAPTWALSDAARSAGARGLLYRSRTRPELEHVVLFDWAGALEVTGSAAPWP
ncbi:RES family NAD+ phosphorylase [Pseudoroseicyclus tamaricis]|uniref:RES family NAD+ phosphorylase n=1 Tax=Pseudoroseicyclus tamaricis TaxID=2705421 RepID=A0A6B2JKG5_9RHOB|nr:RES family NAD+ phosphorylase [Pseudoroseicyclus tamaricis]NDV01981.1 RES family NAD+ phosphorylase [Pseudoroseicyclus tamaricis]